MNTTAYTSWGTFKIEFELDDLPISVWQDLIQRMQLRANFELTPEQAEKVDRWLNNRSTK